MNTAALPSAVISATVVAPARQTTRSAARYCAAMSVKEGLHPGGRPRARVGRGHHGLVRGPGLVDEEEPPPVGQVVQGLDHRRVDAVGALAAAQHQDRERPVRVGCNGRAAGRPAAAAFTISRRRGLPVQRILPGSKPPTVRSKRDEDPVGQPRQDPVGDARQRVLLAQGDRDAQQPGGQDDGPGRIAAQPDHQVRPELPQPAHGLRDGPRQAARAPAPGSTGRGP